MKAVAPAVAPEITYGDLDIVDGGAASAAFYRIVECARGRSSEAGEGLAAVANTLTGKYNRRRLGS
jgi:hypothetical protein